MKYTQELIVIVPKTSKNYKNGLVKTIQKVSMFEKSEKYKKNDSWLPKR